MQEKKDISVICGYIISENYISDEKMNLYIKNFETYSSQVKKIYIYNTSNNEQNEFIMRIKQYGNVEYANVEDFSEAELYKELYRKALEDKADFAVMMRPSYFYEDNSFNELLRYILQSDMENIAVVTPMPLFACEVLNRKAEEYRVIKGCRLIGALVNMNIYNKLDAIDTLYYQTTFDYDYCLQARSKGYFVMLSQNNCLRNQDYKLVTRRFGFLVTSFYERDLKELYYETRNRYYLWKKYDNIDREYVKLDKKLFRQEKREIRIKDKHHKEKFLMIKRGKTDFENGIRGEYN